jgi:hypothetical protein
MSIHSMRITTTNPPLAPNQYPDENGNPYPVMLTLAGIGPVVRTVTYSVGDPPSGVCHHGTPLFTAAVCVDAATMKRFVDFYCAHPTLTTVKVTCYPPGDPVPVSMDWASP